MKKTISTFCFLAVAISVILSLSTCIYAASVDLNVWGYGDNTVYEASNLAARLGKMKRKTSKKFPSLYMTGNKVIIGVNNKAEPGTSASEYIHIENNGNKNFTICGVKIGTPKATMIKKMKAAGFRVLLNGNSFGRGEAGYVRAKYKNGKLTRWEYSLSPTG